MYGQPFRNGDSPRTCRRIRLLHFAKAAIWNALHANDLRETNKTHPPMPDGTSSRPYLAFDFGAESVRAIVARLDSGVLSIKEIRRFQNEPVEYGGGLAWDGAQRVGEVHQNLSGVDRGAPAHLCVCE